jgi:chorismate synthase
MYSVGNRLKISLFGKSHNECIGCIIEGLPYGMEIDFDNIQRMMDLRKPSAGIGTPRKEADAVIFEEGVTDGKVTGRYVLLRIPNTNKNSSAYSGFNITPRPGHADLPALMKFKDFDVSGGAQFSGRMTAPLVAAGAIARQYLQSRGIGIAAYTKSIYDIVDETDRTFEEISRSTNYKTRAASADLDSRMTECIMEASKEEDSVGGIVECMVTGLPIGMGGIWFDALDVTVARLMFSIPAVKGVEFGKGFGITAMKGSESNDQYSIRDRRITATSNNMGGVCGGMSNGMPLTFDVAFKPTPSIGKRQRTVDIQKMRDANIEIKGRHDPCIVPRAVVVVEAMAAIAVMDQYLCDQELRSLQLHQRELGHVVLVVLHVLVVEIKAVMLPCVPPANGGGALGKLSAGEHLRSVCRVLALHELGPGIEPPEIVLRLHEGLNMGHQRGHLVILVPLEYAMMDRGPHQVQFLQVPDAQLGYA